MTSYECEYVGGFDFNFFRLVKSARRKKKKGNNQKTTIKAGAMDIIIGRKDVVMANVAITGAVSSVMSLAMGMVVLTNGPVDDALTAIPVLLLLLTLKIEDEAVDETDDEE